MKKYEQIDELDKRIGDYFSLLNFMRCIDENSINEFDGYGELVYLKDNTLYKDVCSNAIDDICDASSSAYKDDDGYYLVGVMWYNN